MACCLIPLLAAAQVPEGPEVPVALQIPLFLKVLTFDRQLEARSGGELRIAVVHQGRNRESVLVKNEALAALRDAAAADPRLRITTIDLDRESLQAALVRSRAVIAYVAPLRGIDIVDLAATARAAKVTTVTGTPDYVAQGLAISVRYQGERPKLLVNVDAARSEGADLRAELLKLALVL